MSLPLQVAERSARLGAVPCYAVWLIGPQLLATVLFDKFTGPLRLSRTTTSPGARDGASCTLVHGYRLGQKLVFDGGCPCVRSIAAGGFRACAGKHAVEDGAADGNFRLLSVKRPSLKTPPMMDLYRPMAVSTSARLP